jgi:hypothetical protein
MRHHSDRLLNFILTLTSLTMIAVWLPLVRGLMDGDSYRWGHTLFGRNFSGSGVGGDYWFLTTQAVFGISLVYFGWRGAREPFHWLLLLWNAVFTANAFYNAINFPENYRFQGDTLGIDISVAWAAPLFWSVLTLLSVKWVSRNLKRNERRIIPAWNRTNKLLLAAALSLLPLQFVLLRFGAQHGANDQIGVILTMLQWMLLNLSFVKWRAKQFLRLPANA